MKPARRQRVLRQSSSNRIELACQFEEIADVVAEVVLVDPVCARVVRRIDVDELHLPRVALLQELQHFEVVALDHQVLRRVPVDALLGAWAQRAGAGGERELARGALAVPVEPVLLFVLVDGAAEQLPQHVEVDLPFDERLGEERAQAAEVLGDDVGGLRLGSTEREGLQRGLGFGHSDFLELGFRAREVGARHAGVASGLFFGAGEIGGMLGPLLLGVLYDWTHGFAAGLVLFTAVGAGLLAGAWRLRALA